MKNLKTEISNWLNSYLEKNKLKCFVVGVSGGVDSAVVSTLCAETGVRTIVINIPIRSSDKNTELSTLHCKNLSEKYSNVETLNIDASNAFNAFLGDMHQSVSPNGLAQANTKSRLRMMALYYVATANAGIVVGTGNKVEDFGVGFYTKYGDGGVDISPIADLTKTQVRSLAKDLMVDDKIVSAPPTDGLWEDSRTDEDQIGASYEELEWAMETQKKMKDMSNREKQVYRIYKSFNKKNSHKMQPIPIFKLRGRNAK